MENNNQDEQQKIQSFIQVEKNNIDILKKIQAHSQGPDDDNNNNNNTWDTMTVDTDVEDFIKNHPKLWESIQNKNIELSKLIELKIKFLDTYIRFGKKVGEENTHIGKKFHANKFVGQELAKLYFYPYIKEKPTLKNLKKANQKLKKILPR